MGAIRGLSDVHAEGYVHDDLTLSNLVVNEQGNAMVIDFSRHECRGGWEPLEIIDRPNSFYIGEMPGLF